MRSTPARKSARSSCAASLPATLRTNGQASACSTPEAADACVVFDAGCGDAAPHRLVEFFERRG